MIYNQIVTWTAFAILAMFLFESQNENICIPYLKDGLSHEKLEAMANMYKMEDCSNVEVSL